MVGTWCLTPLRNSNSHWAEHTCQKDWAQEAYGELGSPLAERETAVMDLEVQWAACDRGRGTIAFRFEMLGGRSLSVVLLLYLFLALDICEPRYHRVSTEVVPFFCAEHRHNYPGNDGVSRARAIAPRDLPTSLPN